MQNINLMLAGLRDLVSNPTPRVPVALCLDVSGSMEGVPIQELNAGVQKYLEEMRDDDLTLSSVETAVVAFADDAQCAADFTTPDRMDLPELQAGGLTDMGAGLTMALDLLEKRKSQYKTAGVDYYQPILVVMSDGFPNGDPALLKQAEERILQQTGERRLTVVAVGIGPNADMGTLAHLSPRQKPLYLGGLQFREFFAWLSRSMNRVSVSLPGDEPELDLDGLRALTAEPWPEEGL